MRMSLRLIISLVVGVTLSSFLFAVYQVKAEKRGLRTELENRAAIVGESLEGKVGPLISFRSHRRLRERVVSPQFSIFSYHLPLPQGDEGWFSVGKQKGRGSAESDALFQNQNSRWLG